MVRQFRSDLSPFKFKRLPKETTCDQLTSVIRSSHAQQKLKKSTFLSYASPSKMIEMRDFLLLLLMIIFNGDLVCRLLRPRKRRSIKCTYVNNLCDIFENECYMIFYCVCLPLTVNSLMTSVPQFAR